MRKYRLTLSFVLVAIVVMAFTTIMVNRAGGELAEKNLIRMTEENTARDAAHIHSMIRGHRSMHPMASGDDTAGGHGMDDGQQPVPLTLEFLASPDGLAPLTPSLFEGLNIVKFNLFDLDGKTVWSTDPGTFGIAKRESPLFQQALAGGVASKLAKGHVLVGLDGVRRRTDVVETYSPLRESPLGQIIGVTEVNRDVSGDFAVQVDDTKATVFRVTAGYMAGIFLGFIALANMAINRARGREASLAGTKLAERTRTEEELRRARDEAIEANRAKSEFLSRMSHEIRTPMNAIIGMADLLSEARLTPQEREYVLVLTRAGDTLLTLINDILDLSKVEAGQLQFERRDFELGQLVESAVELSATRAHEKGLELNTQVSPDVPTALVGDPVRLGQVLTNLVGNAVKFTEKGEVVLHVENDPEAHEAGCILLRVSDTGIGIPQDRLEYIFDSFSQVDTSTTRKFGGTGLGLAICTRLVEMMGGRIWVESKFGEGSTFYFTVRLELQAGRSRLEAAPAVDMTPIKTLIVDDNATHRMILREMFAAWGAPVTEAEDGYHALAELDRAASEWEPYQLVLLDHRMPGMDGYEVVEHMKNDLRIEGVTILMLTSDRLKGDNIRDQELGISGHLEKPVRRSQVLAEITAATGPMNASEEAPQPPGSPALPEDQRALRILLVEDNEDNRFQVVSYLRETVYELDIAEDGEVGVGMFKSGTYDLVIMDIQMPVMDGYTATREIRQWESENGMVPTPIVALTAYALKEEEEESLEAGCTAHISKPVKKAPFLEAIHEHTRGVTA